MICELNISRTPLAEKIRLPRDLDRFLGFAVDSLEGSIGHRNTVVGDEVARRVLLLNPAEISRDDASVWSAAEKS